MKNIQRLCWRKIIKMNKRLPCKRNNIISKNQNAKRLAEDLKMCLIYKNSKAVFTANINSIFDICWYTLSRFIATNSGSLDLDLSINTENFRSTHSGVCRSYGRYMEMKSNRQLYCKRDDCQRDRNRRKQKDFQQKKRENANL